MPTFIDESGDTGPCADPAHCYFRLVTVWVPTHEEAEAIRHEIRQVRTELALKAKYEFKFTKTWNYPDRREAFFHAAMKREFRFAFVSIDKSHPGWTKERKQKLYWATATELAATLRPTFLAAHSHQVQNGGTTHLKELIILDDNEDKLFLETITRQFRGLGKKENPELFLIGKVKFSRSHAEELLQLADMVCGAIGASLDGNDTWYQLICPRDLRLAAKNEG